MKLNKKLMGTGLAAIMMLSVAGGASAATPTKDNKVDLNIQTGGFHLNVSDINAFDNIVLKPDMPDAYKTSFAGPQVVTDLTGTGDGWNLTVEASKFVDGLGAELKGTALSLDQLKDSTGYGQNSEVVIKQGTQAIDAGPVLVASANRDTGMGEFNLNYDTNALSLNIDPTKAKVGNYKSTLTWTLTNAPA